MMKRQITRHTSLRWPFQSPWSIFFYFTHDSCFALQEKIKTTTKNKKPIDFPNGKGDSRKLFGGLSPEKENPKQTIRAKHHNRCKKTKDHLRLPFIRNIIQGPRWFDNIVITVCLMVAVILCQVG